MATAKATARSELAASEGLRGWRCESGHSGFVYLAGSALAEAAPTPGGVGAVEAVIAGLSAVGVDNEVAVPSVFVFRLATFWLPVLPGWLAFRHLTRQRMLQPVEAGLLTLIACAKCCRE